MDKKTNEHIYRCYTKILINI